MPGRRLAAGRAERAQRGERRRRPCLVVPQPHDVRHRGAVDAQQRPVAERRARAGSTPSSTGVAAVTPGTARSASPRPTAGTAPCGSGVEPDVGARRVRGLVALAARPGRGVRGRERPERRGEDQQQRGAGVAQRPARELAAGERRHEAAGRGRGARSASSARRGHDAHREHRAGEQPDRRCGDEQRVDAERAAGRAGDRRAVQPELDERDRPRARRARGRAPAAAAASGRPGARPRPGRRRCCAPERSVGIVSARSARTPPMSATANVRRPGSGVSRPTPSSAGLSRTRQDEQRREPRRRDHGRDRDQQRLAEGHRRARCPKPAAAGAEQRRLGPAALEEQRRRRG